LEEEFLFFIAMLVAFLVEIAMLENNIDISLLFTFIFRVELNMFEPISVGDQMEKHIFIPTEMLCYVVCEGL